MGLPVYPMTKGVCAHSRFYYAKSKTRERQS